MKIYQRAAEFYFHEKIKAIASQPDRWRVIYFEFSNHPDQYAEGLRTHLVVNMIKDLLKEHEGHIYLMGDGDLAVLMPEPIAPIVAKLGEQIAGLMPELHSMKGGIAVSEASRCTIYDLSLAYAHVAKLAAEKNRQLEARENGQSHRAPTQGEHENKKRQFVFRADAFANATINRGMRDQMLVMVIEDDPFTRRLVGNVLRNDSEVIEAEEGLDALDKYVAIAPDLVLLDIELPDMNGHLVLQEIMRFDPDAFVVMLSGNSQKENVIAALEDGAQGFVTKPFAKEKLFHYLKVARAVKAQRLGGMHTARNGNGIH